MRGSEALAESSSPQHSLGSRTGLDSIVQGGGVIDLNVNGVLLLDF